MTENFKHYSDEDTSNEKEVFSILDAKYECCSCKNLDYCMCFEIAIDGEYGTGASDITLCVTCLKKFIEEHLARRLGVLRNDKGE